MTLEECASAEEYWYSKWLDKLIEEGYVESYEYQVPIAVIDDVSISPLWKLNGINYTADFKIYWTSKALGVFFTTEKGLPDVKLRASDSKRLHYATALNYIEEKDGVDVNGVMYWSYVDVKGKFAGKNNNSAITFPLVQKMIYKLHNIYVQKIVPFAALGLFNYTFTPSDYAITKTGKTRKTLFKVRDLDTYIKSLVPEEPKFTIRVKKVVTNTTGKKGAKNKTDE
jgi:hypothetical protein